jgi:hypothetical protein
VAQFLVAKKVVDSISPQSVRRTLMDHRLKPWRHHLWLSPQVPRDAAFRVGVLNLSDLYSRALSSQEVVWCVDEMR